MSVTKLPVATREPGLLQQLTRQLTTLLRQELALARTELYQSLTRLLSATGSLLGGFALLYTGLLFLLAAAVAGLATVLPLWLAALSVGLLICLGGFGMVMFGKRALRNAQLTPSHLPQSLRQDKDVLMRRTHS
jgi:hypothetical protein